ncbi:hypothetical protein [Verticiella alkaliphila]|nr:hypothetical protein [Verticiella sp. GG226]
MRRKNRNAFNSTPRFGAAWGEALLAVGWAVMIPGLLWLGGAAGF